MARVARPQAGRRQACEARVEARPPNREEPDHEQGGEEVHVLEARSTAELGGLQLSDGEHRQRDDTGVVSGSGKNGGEARAKEGQLQGNGEEKGPDQVALLIALPGGVQQ